MDEKDRLMQLIEIARKVKANSAAQEGPKQRPASFRASATKSHVNFGSNEDSKTRKPDFSYGL